MKHSTIHNSDLVRLPLDLPHDPELAEIRPVLPSYTSIGEPVEMAIQLVNQWGLHLPGHTTELSFSILGGKGEIINPYMVQPDQNSHFRLPVVFSDPNCVYRIRVFDHNTGIEAVSNPCVCQENLFGYEHKLYWGDIHAHRIEVPHRKRDDKTLWHYGPATVDEFYRYARDVVSLDFAALTDHDYALTVDEWREIQEGATFYNQPGKFVTFLGYEWAWNDGASADHGHRNILYYYDDMPLLSASWEGTNTPSGLYQTLSRISRNGQDIISIPHHPARLAHRIWHNWESMDSHFERLMEIYSIWGSSEKEGGPYSIRARDDFEAANTYEAVGHFIQDGLAMGKRFGFTGGSESHDGRAANPVVHGPVYFKQVAFLHRPGLLGVWSRRKTRDCLWSSLWQRRTLATTGPRIIVKMNIDNQPEGEIIKITRPPKKISLEIHGADSLNQVVIVRNNQDWQTFDHPAQDFKIELDSIPYPDNGADCYYLRVSQADGNMAWTSPIWLEDCR